jgi:hypothetical protein
MSTTEYSRKRALIIVLCLGLLVMALGAISATAAPDAINITGDLGVVTDSSSTNGKQYLRYTGNPAPAGYLHSYQWETPAITCSPDTEPVIFSGTLDVTNMTISDTAFLGLLDKGLLASTKSGFFSGAYLYVTKNTATTLVIGPSDGMDSTNDLIQNQFSVTIPADNTVDVNFTIDGAADPNTCAPGQVGANDTGCISVTAEGQTVQDSYGHTKTLQNVSPYIHSEFSQGARPGWDFWSDDATWGSVGYNLAVSGCQAEAAPEVKLTSTDQLVCDGGASLNVDFSNIPNLYGYEFKVNYDAAKATATSAFVDTWFDTSGALIPPGWDAGVCTSTPCKLAASFQSPATPISGGGTVAKVNFAPLAAGTFNATITDVVLSDIDGMPIAVDVNSTPLVFTVCGTATVSGNISLQGRAAPMNPGWVEFTDTANNFSPTTVNFGTNGAYTASVPVMPGGSTYRVRAFHYLYLGNEMASLPLTPGQTLTGQNTRLLGGDANNSGLVGPNYTPGVTTTDIGCIGASFGLAPVNCSDTNGSTDINNDTVVNIQDLSIAGGNYNKNPFQAW